MKWTVFLAVLGCCMPLWNTRSVQPKIPGALPSLGPRADLNETGRFLYKGEATGRRYYCMFCPPKAMLSSTYNYMQQRLCFPPNSGKNWTQYERENNKWAICKDDKESEEPGCGEPPDFGVSRVEWHCNQGYSKELHSVYSSCQLACSTKKNVVAQIYCSESLVWHTDYWEDVPCEEPTTITTTTTTETTTTVVTPATAKLTDSDSGLDVKTVLLVAGGVLLPVILIICLCLRYHKKRSPSQQSSLEDMVAVQNLTRQIRDTTGMTPGPTQGKPPPASVPHWQSSVSTIGNCSLPEHYSIHEDDHNDHRDYNNKQERNAMDIDEEEDKNEEECNESDRLLPNSSENNLEGNGKPLRKTDKSDSVPFQREGVPEVKVFHSNMRDSWQENLETSCKIQDQAYSVPRGSTFYIVPSSPGGIEIKVFDVVRKDGRPYRGEPCPGLNLDFFHTVQNADDADAGMFTWHITLENGQHFQRDFQIFIARGEESPNDVIPESRYNSIQPPDDYNNGGDVDFANGDEVVEHNVEFDSGKKSEEVEGVERPEPDGAEAEPQVRSAVNKPPVLNQIPQVPVAPVVPAQLQNAVPASMNSQTNNLNRNNVNISDESVPHLNILSSSLPNSCQPVIEMGGIEHSDVEAEDRGGVGYSSLDNNHGNIVNNGRGQALRGELVSSPGVSYNRNSHGVVPQLNGQELHFSSILNSSDSPAVSGAQSLPHEHQIGGVLDDASRLTFSSINLPSCMRGQPSGLSTDIPHVENPRPEAESLDLRSDESGDCDVCVSVEENDEYDERHQTYRKQAAEGPLDQCTTWWRNVKNERYLEDLCHMADPVDRIGARRSWFGFGKQHGIEEHKLRAIEYHRRGFIHDGPMRTVLRELEGRLKVCQLVKYFLDNERRDIVDLTIDRCPDHTNCLYCIRLRARHPSS